MILWVDCAQLHASLPHVALAEVTHLAAWTVSFIAGIQLTALLASSKKALLTCLKPSSFSSDPSKWLAWASSQHGGVWETVVALRGFKG